MEISLQKSNQLKSIAILMMLFLHLFNQDYQGLFQPLIFIGKQPLSYYISLFCDACVPVFAFVSGYGLFFKYQESKSNYAKSNFIRIRNLFSIYWIVLVLFVVVFGFLLSKPGYPGDFQTFILNATAIKVSYNGAWWFLTTYLLFVITSSFWFRLLLKLNPYLYLLVLLILYIVSFYFRIYKTDLFSSSLLNWVHTQSALYFCTLFQFMLGAFVLQYRLHSKSSKKIKALPYKNFVLIFGIVLLIVLHGVFPNFFFAPFIAFVFILLYCQLQITPFLQKGIDFFTPHATNMWLVHMFFNLIYFKDFVYSFKYVVPIFIVLVGLSFASSYVINFINKKAQKLL
jgi:hypothetical protein